MKLRIAQALFLLCLIAGTVWILRTHQSQGTFRHAEGAAFGTTYHITYRAADDLTADIADVLRQVDTSLSVFNPESTLSRINRGEKTETDTLLRDVLRLALDVSSQTDGDFDVTVMPLVNAWGFGFKNRADVTDAMLDSLLAFVGWQHLTLTPDGHILRSDPRVQIDLGAIAKGYGVDCVARRLQALGCEDFMIEIGGEIVARGTNEHGKAWQIGVARPDGTADVQEVIALTDSALATSGNYRNFYLDAEGRRVAHTISPHTGRPVSHSLLSATVIAPTCAEADAFATAFMVMGRQRAEQIVRANPRLHAFFIYESHDTLRVSRL